jgi:predicted transcriptional regulator
MESNRTRIGYRTDAGTKQRLTEYADQNHRKINNVITEAVREYLDSKQPTDPTEASAQRLEKELVRVEEGIVKLEGTKGEAGLKGEHMHALREDLENELYPELKGDWKAIRRKAIEDFTDGKLTGPQSELQLIAVCRLGSDLKELKEKQEELTQKLNSLYKDLGGSEQVKGEAAGEKPQLGTQENTDSHVLGS